jgi:hypothetical protein
MPVAMPTTSVRYVGDPVVDELRDAHQDAERRVYGHTRGILLKLDHGVRMRDLRRELRALREALADLALVRHLERALDELAADDEEETNQ